MTLQRWSRYKGIYVETTNGPWIKAPDVVALEKRVKKLEAALETIGGVSNQTCESVDTLAVLSREFIKIAREALEEKK